MTPTQPIHDMRRGFDLISQGLAEVMQAARAAETLLLDWQEAAVEPHAGGNWPPAEEPTPAPAATAEPAPAPAAPAEPAPAAPAPAEPTPAPEPAAQPEPEPEPAASREHLKTLLRTIITTRPEGKNTVRTILEPWGGKLSRVPETELPQLATAILPHMEENQ